MKKKIVIFGATGNIGAYLTDYLANSEISKKYEIIAAGRRFTNFFDRYKIKYIALDITKEKDFEKLPKDNVFAVVMLAGILPAYMPDYQPRKYLEVNTGGGTM